MLNLVAVVGRLVADPELKYTPSGVAVCSFRIAVNRRFKGESNEQTADFFDVVAWRQQAEFVANYMSKGRLVSVSGRLRQDTWVQQDGQKRSRVQIVADDVQGLEPKSREGGPAPGAGDMERAPAATAEQPPDFDSNMDYDPFVEE